MTSHPVDADLRNAERARTVLAQAPTVAVEVEALPFEEVDVHAVEADGSLLLLMPASSPLVGTVSTSKDALPCAVHAARFLSAPGPDRILDDVTLYGRAALVDAADADSALALITEALPDRPTAFVMLQDGSALLRFTVMQVRLDWDTVDPELYSRAVDDPVAAGSDAVVSRLVRDDPDQVATLVNLIDPEVRRGARAVAPVCVDRHGLTFRITSEAGTTDVRLDFPAALDGSAELPAAMQALRSRAAQVPECS